MRHVKIYESFQTKDEISKICKKYNIEDYIISSDGLVDVVGNVDLKDLELTKLPLKFGKIDGDFHCDRNKLTSLEGAPQTVTGSFICRTNMLTSLEGAPQTVTGSFICDFNRLISLKGAPESVGGNFYSDNNELITLEGAPKSVGGDFHCDRNKLTSLEGAPESVGGSFNCNYNQLTSLEGAPESVADVFYCDRNQLTSLEGAPLECGTFSSDGIYIGNYKYPKSLLKVLHNSSESTKQLILTIMSADYFNKQLIENPEKTIMSLKSVWNDPEFKEIRKDIIIPTKYKDMLKLTTNLADIGF